MKTPPHIYLADDIHNEGKELLKKQGFVLFSKFGLSNVDLINFISKWDSFSVIPSALVIRSNRKILLKELIRLKKNTNIKIICTASSGFDNIDYWNAKYMGFKIMNVPYGNFISASEHTLALILAIVKNIRKYARGLSEAQFKEMEYSNIELFQKTIGIVGVGRVGLHLARLCRPFGMKILGNDIKKTLSKKYKWIKFCTLQYLIKKSDIITVHTPFNESTRDLINGDLLKEMKSGAIVINCARGGIINERALIERLRSKKIYYAGLDVFINEPTINEDFRKLNNVILTPHQAGKTIESRIRISSELAEGLIKEFKKYCQ